MLQIYQALVSHIRNNCAVTKIEANVQTTYFIVQFGSEPPHTTIGKLNISLLCFLFFKPHIWGGGCYLCFLCDLQRIEFSHPTVGPYTGRKGFYII